MSEKRKLIKIQKKIEALTKGETVVSPNGEVVILEENREGIWWGSSIHGRRKLYNLDNYILPSIMVPTADSPAPVSRKELNKRN